MGLVCRPLRRRYRAIASQAFRLSVSCRIGRTRQGGKRRNPKLTGRFENKRNAFSPMPTQSHRDLADWIHPPVTRLVARSPIHPDHWLAMFRTVIRTQQKNRRCLSASQFYSVRLLLLILDLG